MNYYNEFEPFAAQWLRNLIDADLIPHGHVDDRSIKEVTPDDLRGYTQCHWFAGVGGWSLALQLAGWPADREVWTGSCPCQPFSVAGRGKGTDDERHLWPEFYRLIKACKPPVVFGEQVASAIRSGWLDGVAGDLEAADYEFGSAVLPACVVGAPHERERLWWSSHSKREGLSRRVEDGGVQGTAEPPIPIARNNAAHKWFGLEADFFSLLPSDGVSLAMERRRVHAYGNAIVPQVAAEFIAAFMETV